mgnify:CR=1 FL=1
MKKLFGLLTIITFVGLSYTAQAAVETGAMAPSFTAVDTHGEEHSLSDFAGKYVVLEWSNYDCPFVKKHYSSGNMQAIQKELAGDDLVWLTIFSSADGKQGSYTADEANAMMEERDVMVTAALFDRSGNIGQAYGAKTTPHMFVLDKEGKVAYQGAIDDKPSPSKATLEGATNYVVNAVAQLRAGEAVSVTDTKAYGCGVKYE